MKDETPLLTLASRITANIAKANLPDDVVEHFIKHSDQIPDALNRGLEIPPVFSGKTGGLPEVFDWKGIYAKLGLDTVPLEQVLTEPKAGFWDIYVAQGLTRGKVLEALRAAKSRVWQYYNDLDKDVVENDRDARKIGTYGIRIKASVEADPELKDLSANQLKEKKVLGITLLERLLLEYAYFITTGEHLDKENWTLCSGSRRRYGGVPIVRWLPGYKEVCVDAYYPSYAYDELRSRAVVPL